MLREAAIWEIVVYSTCRKQSEYFDQRNVGRLLTCYIYNGIFCDNSLRLDHTNIYYHKELYRRLTWQGTQGILLLLITRKR